MPLFFNLKFVVIGPPGVGKTSLIKNFISGSFIADYKSTIGTNIFSKDLLFHTDEDIVVRNIIWDIAGQVQWDTMRPAYYKGSRGVCIVADLSRKRSFQEIEKFWVPDVRKNLKKNIPIILLANKNDLKAEISEEEVRKVGNRCGIDFVLFTSAKTSYHVQEAFISLTKKGLKMEHVTYIGPSNEEKK